jgi:uncharacterized protein YecE (DUF72 family)
MNLYVGCPVWANKAWVGNFYPKGTKSSAYLREYARRLTTVEGNTTFYAVPAADTVSRWAAETPETFRFCPKVPKTISHTGPLEPHLDEARGFVETMRPLGSRLGPMFLQLPPRYSPRMLDDLRAFLDAWPRDVRLAVEVRHDDWFEPAERGHRALNDMLGEHDMARVLIDTRPIRDMPEAEIGQGSVYVSLKQAQERKPNVPLLPELNASFAFVRYIGHPTLEFNADLLDDWAARVAGWLGEGADVFAFCHSPEDVTAPWIARELHGRIEKLAEVTPLPWAQALGEQAPEQARMRL